MTQRDFFEPPKEWKRAEGIWRIQKELGDATSIHVGGFIVLVMGRRAVKEWNGREYTKFVEVTKVGIIVGVDGGDGAAIQWYA